MASVRNTSEFCAVSVVVPVWNEVDGLPDLFSALADLEARLADHGFALHVVITDNHSTDGSWSAITAWLGRLGWAEAHQFTRNYGFQESILFGLSRALGDCAVVLQSDLQDPPELVLEFVRRWTDGAATVAGQAISRAEGTLVTAIRGLFYRLLDVASDAAVVRGVQDFYLLDRRVVDDILASKPPTSLLRTYVAEHFGFSSLVPYERRARLHGEASLGLADYYRLALDGLLLTGARALRLLTVLSFCLAGLALLCAIGLLAAYAAGWRPPVSGWMSLAVGFGLTLAVLGISSGIVLEYLRRLAALAQPGPRAVVWRTRVVPREVHAEPSTRERCSDIG